MLRSNGKLAEQAAVVEGLFAAVPSSSTPDYVSMKNYERFTAIINVKNGVTVTGSAITLKQATNVAAGNEKALAFDTVKANTDTAASQLLTDTAVASNTFTTDNTNSKNLMYIIDIPASALDVTNGFDCIRVGTGNATNATVHVTYILWPARYGQAQPPNPIVD